MQSESKVALHQQEQIYAQKFAQVMRFDGIFNLMPTFYIKEVKRINNLKVKFSPSESAP
jgi:hypothetical protein